MRIRIHYFNKPYRDAKVVLWLDGAIIFSYTSLADHFYGKVLLGRIDFTDKILEAIEVLDSDL